MTVKQFGASGAATAFGQFGSKTASAPQTSQNPSIIMQLAAWATGWTAAAVGAAFNPYLEDMNGFCLVVMYFLANLFERGVPDWDAATTYYKGALVQDPAGSGQEFYSLTDNNVNNALPLGASNAQWRWNNPPLATIAAALAAGVVPRISATAAAGGAPGSEQLEAGLLSDDGTNVVIGGVAGTNGLKFPDGSVQKIAAVASWPTTKRVVTGTRAAGIPYQNTTGKALYVSIMTSFSGGGYAYSDQNNPPATMVTGVSISGGAPDDVCVHFIVLPGDWYMFNNGFVIWTEWF